MGTNVTGTLGVAVRSSRNASASHLPVIFDIVHKSNRVVPYPDRPSDSCVWMLDVPAILESA